MVDNLGLGLGLQATPNTAQPLFMMNEQKKLRMADAQLKLAFDKKRGEEALFEKKLKDFSLPENYKWHRLLADEAIAVSNDAVERLLEAKNSGDPNWRNAVVKIGQDYNSKMTRLVPKNENYMAFDKSVPQYRYVTQNQKLAQQAFAEAKDQYDLETRLQQYGVKSDRYLTINEDLYFDPRESVKINVDQTLGNAIKRVAPVLSKVENFKNDSGVMETRKVNQRPLTIADAEEVARQKPDIYKDGTRPFSLEDMANELMTDDEFVYQFADKFKIDYQNPVAIREALMDKLKFGIDVKETYSFTTPRVTNINIDTTQDQQTDYTDFNRNEDVLPSGRPLAKPGDEVNVKIFGSYEPAVDLQTLKGVEIKRSVYYGDGTTAFSAPGQSKTFGPNARFTNYVVLPYYKDGSYFVPVSEKNKNKKAEGFAVFAHMVDGQFGYYQEASAFTLPNQVEGDKNERANILANYRKMQKQVAAADAAAKKELGASFTNDEYTEAFKKAFQAMQ